MSLLVDIRPLRRFPQFRRLWLGYLVSTMGSQLTMVATPFEVYRLTHSSLDVGLVSLAQLGPLLAVSVFGGAIADAMDRRVLLIITELSAGCCSVGLALDVSFRRPALWPLFVVSALAAGISAIDLPARSAMSVSLIDAEHVASATALWQLLLQVGAVAGPAIAGLLIGAVGVSSVYWIDAITFAAAAVAVVGLRPAPPAGGRVPFGLQSVAEGFRYLRGRPALQGTFVADLNAMIFGMPRALFPAIGLVRLGGGAGTVGLLYAAPGAGALIGALLTGWVARVRRQGRAVLVAVAVWGLAITLFGFAPWLAAALPLLALAGAADVVSAVFRGTMLQQLTTDALRGRLSAVHAAVVTGGPRLGDLEAGGVATLAGVETSVVSGGLACLVGVALIAWRLPGFGRYDAGVPAPGGVTGAEAALFEADGRFEPDGLFDGDGPGPAT